MTNRLLVVGSCGDDKKTGGVRVLFLTSRLLFPRFLIKLEVVVPIYVVHVAALGQFLVESEAAFQVLWRMAFDTHREIFFQKRFVIRMDAVVEDATSSLDRRFAA